MIKRQNAKKQARPTVQHGYFSNYPQAPFCFKSLKTSLHTDCQSHNSYTCHKAKGSPLPPTLINVRRQEECKCAYHKAKAHLFLLNLHQDIHTPWFPECTTRECVIESPIHGTIQIQEHFSKGGRL